MDYMFNGASAFDQDLGWCVKACVLSSGTEGETCGDQQEKTLCGVRSKAGLTHATAAGALYHILIVLLVLLACFGAASAVERRRTKHIAAAARRVLRCCFCCCCCICCRKKEKSSVNLNRMRASRPANGCRVLANAPLVGVLKELSSHQRTWDEVRGGAYNGGRRGPADAQCGHHVRQRKPRNSTVVASRSQGRSTSSSTRARSSCFPRLQG